MPSRTLSRDAIKSIAMLTMLLNHISTVFLSPDSLLGAVLLDIGYFTAVTMCYFLVEGYGYTRSKKQYALRLALFAALSEVPYCLAFTEEGVLSFCGMNMIFTLFLCFLVLVVMERVHSRLWRELALLGLVLLSLISDWALLAPIFTLLFYNARGDREKVKAAFVLSALFFGVISFAGGLDGGSLAVSALDALGNMAGIALAALVILRYYNGHRAPRGRTFYKWFFYWFYPLHLLELGLFRLAL